jgi:Protein of unknown function (DUF3892)
VAASGKGPNRTKKEGHQLAAYTYLVTHRRMQSSPGGTHQHVGWVKLLGGTVLSRDDVFRWMAEGHVFKTYAPNGQEARIGRVHCSLCKHDYLRTDRDLSKADNLDALPLF